MRAGLGRCQRIDLASEGSRVDEPLDARHVGRREACSRGSCILGREDLCCLKGMQLWW